MRNSKMLRKRVMASVLALAMASSTLIANPVDAQAKTKKAVTSVKITNVGSKTLVMKKGKSFKLKTSVKVKGGASKKVTFKSSNDKVVSVSSTGKLKAKKNGTAKITVRSTFDRTKKATLTVKVGTPVTKIKVKSKSVSVRVGKKVDLKASVSPSSATIKKLTYTSSNKKVATVSSKGIVTGKKSGKASITIKSTDGTNKKTVVKVTVKKATTTTTGKPGTTTEKPTTTTEKPGTTTGKPTTTTGKPGTTTEKPATTQKPTTTEKPATTEKPTTTEKPATTEEPVTPDTPDTPDTPEDVYNPDVPLKLELEDTDSTAADYSTLRLDGEESSNYELVWSDNFQGDKLNDANWNVETHESGWVNAELQAYVDDAKNIYVEDGNLVLRPVRVKDENGNDVITSGRVNTMGKHDYTYGVFEVRAKVPTGQGFLPAFWMMPTDENIYGQWPRCGEIDIMEVMGQETNKVYGTIHYGNPHSESQNTSTLATGSFADEYHTFTCKWEPGKITWYVDGVKYHEENDWYSTTVGQGTVAYPAPFDQPFYMILNLAVGGSWVGYPDDSTTINDQAYVIDYVKVYRNKAGYDDSNVEKPVTELILREPVAGNYVHNGDFSQVESLTKVDGAQYQDWQFMTALGGDAGASIDNNEMVITTNNAGTVDYSVQLVQADIPFEKGATYHISFKAKASEARKANFAIKAPDRGFMAYVSKDIDLTTEYQTFEYDYKMPDATDDNARVEFNMGNCGSTATIYIDDVSITKTAEANPDEPEIKTVRADGNCVYNGAFQEGTSPKGMEYWEVTNSCEAATGVTGLSDGRQFKVQVTTSENIEALQLSQTDLPILPNQKYSLSFDAYADANKTISVVLAGETYEFELSEGANSCSKVITTAETLTNKDIVFNLGVVGELKLDNIRVEENALIKNGSFNAGLAGFETYINSPASATYVVDSQSEDNAYDITINDTGADTADNDWYIQLKQNNVSLEEGKCYKLTFDVRSNIDRKIKYALQKDGTNDDVWTQYAEDTVELTASDAAYTTIEKKFKMENPSDLKTIFSITMGSVGGERITTQHRICIDNISLVEIDENEMPAPPVVAGKEYDVNLFADPTMAGQDTWTLIKGVDTNTAAVAESVAKYSITDLCTNPYDVELKQENLTLEKGEYYVVSFDIKSTKARKVQAKFQQNGTPWTAYKKIDINLPENEVVHFVSEEFKMTYASDDKALFAIDMGNFGEAVDAHEIEISNLSYKKVHHETQTVTETLNVNKLTVADDTKTTTGSEANPWDVQIQQVVSMVKGYTYKLSFTVNSEAARRIAYGVQRDGDAAHGALAYGTYKESAIDLVAGVNTPVEFEFVMPADDEKAVFFVNMAQEGAAGNVTIKDVKLVATAAPVATANLLNNPTFDNNAEGWEAVLGQDWAGSVGTSTLADGKATYDIENVGTANWNVQLKQTNLSLSEGKTYVVKMNINSTVARKVQVVFSDSIDAWLASNDVNLIVGDNEVEFELTPTSAATVFVIFMGKINSDATETGTIIISDLSVTEK